jgi:hypothetical protein
MGRVFQMPGAIFEWLLSSMLEFTAGAVDDD